MALLNNPQPPSRATGGNYGLKTFQNSIKKKKKSRDQWGQKQRKAEGRGKLKAKEVQELHIKGAFGTSVQVCTDSVSDMSEDLDNRLNINKLHLGI